VSQLHNPKVASSSVLPSNGGLNKDITSVSALLLMNPGNTSESLMLIGGTNPPTPANKKKLLARSADMDDSKLEIKKFTKRSKISRLVVSGINQGTETGSLRNSVRDNKEIFLDREIGKLNKGATGQNSLGSVGHTQSPQDTSVFDLKALKQRYKHAENMQRAKQEARLLTEGCAAETPHQTVTQRLPQSTTDLSSSPLKVQTTNQVSTATNNVKKHISITQTGSKGAPKTSKQPIATHHTSNSPSVSRINAALNTLPTDSKVTMSGAVSPHRTSVHLNLNAAGSATAASRMSTGQKNPTSTLNTSAILLSNKKNSVSKLHHNQFGMESHEPSKIIPQPSSTSADGLGTMQSSTNQTVASNQKKKSFAGGLASMQVSKPDTQHSTYTLAVG
jgi:hypothetical protein